MKKIQQLNSSQTQQLKQELVKILSLDLDITGELVEIALERVYPEAKRLTLNTKDKRWIDVILPQKGIEVKTFQVAKSLKSIITGTQVSNVLKRVSQVTHLAPNGNRRDAEDIGKDIINYLHSTIQDHANQKGVTGELTMGVLFRTVDKSHFAYWEQELHFGAYTDYEWTWNVTETKGKETYTIVAKKEGEFVLRWYCENQKQLFYTYTVPSDAVFFEIKQNETKQKAFIVTEEELQSMIAEAIENGKYSSK
ncbi:hypothetical protein [Bacillus haynesii]|uniref:hypothetical protein n=1 Tax=Bacillus haynesii TaxID=1925021 RepID=UPI00227FC514|nr:hypothetical protein [Bacillus haynesii]MCY7912994.1 hypothetical protein [Bacillus haynesii]MCY7927201.1 hypothetical protein [Bacillus haynesii]MCY8758339.1 hypothetical protein [Bacillus haynesii]MCY8771898.1 hypothetical protein [Bacillus haynesii]MEC0789370.1 hypothetical protein [Bacillus haynesii]